MLERIRNAKKRLNHHRTIVKNWWKMIFPFNRFYDRPTTLTSINGFTIHVRSVRSRDFNIIKYVLMNDEYHIDTLHLPPAPIIYDIGGHIGTFSMKMKRKYPSAKITICEPDDTNFQLLRCNAPFATLHRCAVTSTSGIVQFMQSEKHNPDGLHIVAEGGVPVLSMALKDLCSDSHIDLLKMDIEGGEYDVLENSPPHIFKHIERILMEAHGESAESRTRNILESLGYELVWIDRAGSNILTLAKRI